MVVKLRYWLLGVLAGVLSACGDSTAESDPGGLSSGGTDSGGSSTGGQSTGGTINVGDGGDSNCEPTSCAELGWACGYTIDPCTGEMIDCADEGRACGPDEACVGGIDSPTECVAGGAGSCELCSAIPDCSDEPQETLLEGRVISPGRADDDTGNQVGVPNAIVYILRNNDVDDLPAISTGIPEDGESCDRCEDQDLGPVLAGAVTDATGHWEIEGNIPVGVELLLVVKAGKFRRATTITVPEDGACATNSLPETLPDTPTRLPRDMEDGLAVNIPRIAVSTGSLDAMECVFNKMGIADSEFANPGADGDAPERVHLYRGGSMANPSGARVDDDTPHDSELYGDPARLLTYDMVVADCEGPGWDSSFNQRDANGANLIDYLNRGGRMFASHLSFTWLHDNGTAEYSEDDPYVTGLGPAATWVEEAITSLNDGTGVVSLDEPAASPRIENFAEWMVSEGVTTAPDYEFNIQEPRSQVESLGASTEQFVHCDGQDCVGDDARVQQFSFNTPYGAPDEAACGRVAYSGFHVSVGNAGNVVFPDHCGGDLTDQEKVLLYMLFDLGACVGIDPPGPPPCVPVTCEEAGADCGYINDGCGNVVDCGVCTPPK